MQIIPLITSNFVLLAGISCLIAFPVAYLFMDNWLKNISIQHRFNDHTIFNFCNGSIAYYNAYRDFPYYKSSDSQPGKEFEI